MRLAEPLSWVMLQKQFQIWRHMSTASHCPIWLKKYVNVADYLHFADSWVKPVVFNFGEKVARKYYDERSLNWLLERKAFFHDMRRWKIAHTGNDAVIRKSGHYPEKPWWFYNTDMKETGVNVYRSKNLEALIHKIRCSNPNLNTESGY